MIRDPKTDESKQWRIRANRYEITIENKHEAVNTGGHPSYETDDSRHREHSRKSVTCFVVIRKHDPRTTREHVHCDSVDSVTTATNANERPTIARTSRILLSFRNL